MASKNRITTYLKDEDKHLFDIATVLYGKEQSELAREIISNWLFNNKLQLTAASRLQAKSI